MTPEAKLRYLPLLFRDGATNWYGNLPNDQKDTYEHLLQAFRAQYVDEAWLGMTNTSNLWGRSQGANESVKDYFTEMRKISRTLNMPPEMVRFAIVKELRQPKRTHVMRSAPETLDDAFQ